MRHTPATVARRAQLLLPLLGASMLAGCATELRSVRLTEAAVAANQVPLLGAPYNLTFTHFEIRVNRTLTACTPGAKEPQVEVAVAATAKPVEARDTMREYIIDFGALRAFFKTSGVSVEYHANGALKSVNAKVADETGPALASVLAVAGKVAIAGAAGVAPMVFSLPLDRKKCSDKVMKALDELKGAETTVNQAQQALEFDDGTSFQRCAGSC